MNLRHCIAMSSFLSACVVSNAAFATLITVDFESPSEGLYVTDYLEQGFRFEVQECHWDSRPSSDGAATSKWFGFDRSGCGAPADGKPSGIADSMIRVSRDDGQSFDVVSFDVARTGFRVIAPDTSQVIPAVTGLYDFVGAQWQGISEFGLFAGGSPIVGFDNLTLRVTPEPNSMAVVCFALAMYLFANRVTHRWRVRRTEAMNK